MVLKNLSNDKMHREVSAEHLQRIEEHDKWLSSRY
jgi:hypothetical protein